jgi:peptidyl-prolyl cis-trans isomerase SurA
MHTLGTMALLAGLAAAEPRGEVVDRLAAVVNDELITLSELEERAGPPYRQALQMPAGPGRDKARAQALRAAFDQLLAEKLLEGQVASLQIEVADSEVDAAVEDVKHSNRLNDQQLAMAVQNQGMTMETFRTNMKKQLEYLRIMQLKVRNRVKVADEDVRNYYQTHPQMFAGEEQVRVRHIFLEIPPKATSTQDAAIRRKGERILQRLRSGEDFAKVAKEVSEGPSAKDGGDLGFLKRGTSQPEVDRVAFGLRPGEISGLVKTRFGYQILKIEDRRMGGAQPFEQVREQIRDRLYNEQLETFKNQYVAELRKDALIETKLPELQEPATK